MTQRDAPDSEPKTSRISRDPTPSSSDAETDEGERDNDELVGNVKTIVGAVAVALLLRIALFEPFAIDGPSMEPSLLNGDRVVVSKYPYGLFLPGMNEAVLNWGAPDVGDVVIVKSPADQQDIVKRVIGVAGDTVSMVDGQVFRNGEPIPTTTEGPCEQEEQKRVDPACRVYREEANGRSWQTSHGDWDAVPRDLSDWTAVTVPEGYVVVLGDHRDQSNDSRRIGLIPLNRVKGRALFIYWSRDPGRERRFDRMFEAVR